MKELRQPLFIRLHHWTMAVSVVILTVTGLYLSQPFGWLSMKMSTARFIHLSFCFIALANLGGHIAFYVITKTYNDILFRWQDMRDMLSFVKYLFFIAEPHPNFGKYNPAQRLLINLWAVLLIIGGAAGLSAYFPGASSICKLYGGPSGVKWTKYLIAVFFASTIPLHMYLVFTEDPAKLQAMFTGYVRKRKISPPEQRQG